MATVLVVDDDPSVRSLFALMLQRWNYAVLVVETPDQGLALAVKTRFDAACLDVGLFGQDGFVLCRELRARAAEEGRELPVLMFSGAPSQEAERKTAEAGAHGLWRKPFHWPDLRAQLDRLVTHVSSREG